jgi:hypothetical protein
VSVQGDMVRKMTSRARIGAVALAMLLAGSAAACESSTPSGPPSQLVGGSGGTPVATAATVHPPELALANVATDRQRAVGARIGPAGGTVAATGADGTTYALAIPADALAVDTVIGVYPVTHLAGLPTGNSLTAGVQFTPDGLILRRPATLTVTLPAGASATGLSGVGWSGDGAQIHAAPVIASAQAVTLDVFHFSGGGVGTVPLQPLACASEDWACEINVLQFEVSRDAPQPNARSLLMTDLRQFSGVVEDAFREAAAEIGGTATTPPNPLDEDTFALPYEVFLRELAVVRVLLDDPTFGVDPEMGRLRAEAATFTRNWFDVENEQCRNHAGDASLEVAVNWASVAMDEATTRASDWSIATAANKLDLETLLNDACVQVVIDPGRRYTATGPGTNGSIELDLGFTVGGGPLVIRDLRHFVHVVVTYTGDSLELVDQDATDGHVSVPDIRWPDGVDPVRFDVRATLVENVDGAVVPTKLARFDRVTKSTASKIAYTVAVTGGEHIEVVDSDGANPTSLTNGPHDSSPAWAPDRSRIAFVRESSIWSIKADGTDLQQLTSGAGDSAPAWSPDGSQIAFQRLPTGATGVGFLTFMDADGGNVRETGVQSRYGITWAPDGKQLAYSTQDPVPMTRQIGGKDVFFSPNRIFIYDIASATSTKLVTHACEPWGAALPDWSPDGTSIVFLCAREGPKPTQIATMTPSGGGFSVLWTAPNDSGYWASWAPDSQRVAIAGGQNGVMIVGGSGGTIASGRVGQLDWAP